MGAAGCRGWHHGLTVSLTLESLEHWSHLDFTVTGHWSAGLTAGVAVGANYSNCIRFLLLFDSMRGGPEGGVTATTKHKPILK